MNSRQRKVEAASCLCQVPLGSGKLGSNSNHVLVCARALWDRKTRFEFEPCFSVRKGALGPENSVRIRTMFLVCETSRRSHRSENTIDLPGRARDPDVKVVAVIGVVIGGEKLSEPSASG